MAVTSVPVLSDLILVIDNGIGAAGQQLILNRAVKDVKPAAADADVYDVALAVSDLQSKSVMAVQRRNVNELINA